MSKDYQKHIQWACYFQTSCGILGLPGLLATKYYVMFEIQARASVDDDDVKNVTTII